MDSLIKKQPDESGITSPILRNDTRLSIFFYFGNCAINCFLPDIPALPYVIKIFSIIFKSLSLRSSLNGDCILYQNALLVNDT